jgi:hypothetical protein
MTMRSFILRDSKVEDALHAFIRMNAKSMYESKHPMEVVCREFKPKASDPQRALIWIINEQIAQQAWIGGRQFDAETWHEHCKREMLPDECASGVKKWRVTPTGDRELNMSTEHLDREEKTAYIDALLAYAASLGVIVQIEERDHA